MSPRSKEENQQILEQRREQILSAALKVFALRGLTATKISNIASAAGLSHGLVYHYFKSKDEIFTELVKRAFSMANSVAEYTSQLNASPWEKIRTYVEITTAGVFTGDGVYYWDIVIQAYTSEAVPETVKKLVEENRSTFAELFVPVFIEGQKASQFAQDDPHMLTAALRSMIYGMALRQMLSGDIADVSVLQPDANMIMRLFQNPEYAVSRPASHAIKTQLGPIQWTNKPLTYRFKGTANAEIKTSKVIVTELMGKGGKVLRIESKEETGASMVSIVDAETSLPITIVLNDPQENTSAKIEYRGQSVEFNRPDRTIQKQVNVSGAYYDSYTLTHILQGFPFHSDKKITLTIISDGTSGSPVGPSQMEFQKIGREIIRVPAGDFDCYKLQMGIPGISKAFAGMYDFFFWYAADEPRFLVKYEDTLGNSRELIKLE